MNSFLQKLPSLISKTLKPRSLSPHSHLSKPTIHTQQLSPNPTFNDSTVKAICKSFRLGSNWDSLSNKFQNLDLNEALIQKVLLELKQPIDAKNALGFFHWSAKTKGFEHCIGSYSIAIHILVRAKMNLDAKALLESVLKRNSAKGCSDLSVVDSLLGSFWVTDSNPFVFDLLVQCYSKLRMFDQGFEVCKYLEENGFCLKLSTFNVLLHVVEKSSESFSLAWEIYEHMIRARIWPDEVTFRTLIGCLCKEGKLSKCVETLDRICGKRCNSPSVIVNINLIIGILEQGRVEDGMSLLKRMLVKNMVFDTIAYSLVVYGKLKLGELDSSREMFEEMLKRGFRPNSFVHTLFIGAYCDKGRVDEASLLMEDMEIVGLKPYDETFSSLVEGYARVGRVEDSLRISERMLEMGFAPSRSAFNMMIEGLCVNGDMEKANSMLTIALERQFLANEATYATLIDGYGKKGDVDEVLKLFYEMEGRSLSPGSSVFSAMVKCLCQVGRFKEAERYLGIMKHRSVGVDQLEPLYETLISCYIENGDTNEALRLQNKIVLKGK